MEGGATSCIPHLWAFHTSGRHAEAKPSFGFLSPEQVTLLGSWWDTKCALGISQELGLEM